MNSKCGKQTIGCEVTSCRHNAMGCECDLTRIEVRPAMGNTSGDPCESQCASYKVK